MLYYVVLSYSICCFIMVSYDMILDDTYYHTTYHIILYHRVRKQRGPRAAGEAELAARVVHLAGPAWGIFASRDLVSFLRAAVVSAICRLLISPRYLSVVLEGE